jgi:hypothetical protein
MKIPTYTCYKALFYNVIIWNMKYLFFFKGQPLLLCCVWCKIAIQDFLTGLHKKKLRFHRRVYRRTITRRYFTESCKIFTGFCHIHRRITDGFADVQYRRNHRRRTHVWHVSVCRITDGISDGFADGSKILVGFLNFFGAHFN